MLIEPNQTTPATPHDESRPTLGSSTHHSYLTGDIYLLLHTRNAQALFKGQWRRNSMGLLQFANLMQKMWQAVKEGDPYAEWHLMTIYEHIEALKTDMQQLERHCQEKIAQLRGFDVQLFHQVNPLRVLLQFSTPFAYMAAHLLADFDYLSRQAYTLKRLGLVLELDKLPVKIKFKLRRLFESPLRWRYTGITRQDILDNNQKAQAVKKMMGTLPVAILNQDIQFALLPKPKPVENKTG